jgi:uncharacterized membrane protein
MFTGKKGMPYCCQCGQKVASVDTYCASCGARQPASHPEPDYLHGIRPATASLLCYVPLVGWLAAIIVLASSRFRRDMRVRFHAFQGLYLFVAWLIVDWVLSPLFRFPGFGGPRIILGLLRGAIVVAWIFMMIKASRNEYYKLPILGELAERSVAEQK